jgi:hypothetical protein
MSVGAFKQPVDSSLTANGVAQDALAYNAKRLNAVIENHGTAIVWVAFGADAVLGQGHSIPAGGVGFINIETDADTWMGDRVSVITDGTPCDLAISEVTK